MRSTTQEILFQIFQRFQNNSNNPLQYSRNKKKKKTHAYISAFKYNFLYKSLSLMTTYEYKLQKENTHKNGYFFSFSINKKLT